MNDYLIKIWMDNDEKYIELVKTEDIVTLEHYLEQELADQSGSCLKLWNNGKQLMFYNKHRIKKISVEQYVRVNYHGPNEIIVKDYSKES